jgi:hypothetical protein
MNEENNGQLSQEEVKARRSEITKFYKDQIPHLKVQAEYERLMTEIEENRAKRMQAQAFLANAYMEIEGAKDDGEVSEANKEAQKEFEKMKNETLNEDAPKRRLKKVLDNE